MAKQILLPHVGSDSSCNSELVVKSNRLIEASYRLNLVEQQMILFSIVQCREEQRGLSAELPVSIRAADFAARFGIDKGNVYRQLKEALDTLYKRDVRIHDTHPKTGKPRVVNTRWISDKAYIDGAGTVEMTFSPKILPFITRLESEFTTYRLEKIGRMTSIHAVRLYELLIQYLTIGKREIEIGWLKDTMQVNEYSRLDNLKRRVIDVAVGQINEHSNINVRYRQRKSGRVVTHLNFEIRLKQQVRVTKPSIKIPTATAGAFWAGTSRSDPRAHPGELRADFERRMAVST